MSIDGVLTTGIVQSHGGVGHGPSALGNGAKIEEAAKQFESLLIAQMLKSAREAGDGSWAGGDDENSTLIDLAEQQFAGALAAGGGLGIAKMVTAGLAARSDHPTE